MNLVLLTLLSAAPDAALQAALEQAVAQPGVRVELARWEAPRGCQGAFAATPIEASGRVPVRVRGSACEGWGWATVRLLAPAAVLTRDVSAGAPLDGAWILKDLEQRRGHGALVTIPEGSTASRSLRAGASLTPEAVRVGPPPGTPVTVRVVVGSLSIEQGGTITACRGSNVCAVLPTGRRVEGTLADGVLTARAADAAISAGGRP